MCASSAALFTARVISEHVAEGADGGVGRFLYQMDHLGEEDYVPNPVLEKALDVLFLIHADHELNASCTTVLQTASSLVDPYSAVA